jgi:hypothetical protein
VQKVVGLGNLVTGLLIGGDQRRGAQPQWHQPARIFSRKCLGDVQMAF